MSFIAHNFKEPPATEAFVTVDKFNRLMLSAGLCKKLGIVDGAPFKCHIGYDEANGNIGIARPGEISVDDNVTPATFDGKRHYAGTAVFIRKHNLKLGRYMYIERANGWYAFRHEEDESPTSPAPAKSGRKRKDS
ncbi:hypothetical protein [Brevibacillus daliensis]|uniref:hypothetical protein n=1 Tax=Brevibacillus daliensis TaxID=2892995 RepID=UPI001E5E11B8|nr:hypothetical protein [Brevibacillus daliensis]